MDVLLRDYLLTPSAKDDPKLPIHLLVYAVQTAVTTLTCIADYLSWTGFSNAQKIELGKLYVPYLALCKSWSHISNRHDHRNTDRLT